MTSNWIHFVIYCHENTPELWPRPTQSVCTAQSLPLRCLGAGKGSTKARRTHIKMTLQGPQGQEEQDALCFVFYAVFCFWGHFSFVAIKKEQSENWYKSIKRYLAPYEQGFFLSQFFIRILIWLLFSLLFFSLFLSPAHLHSGPPLCLFLRRRSRTDPGLKQQTFHVAFI